MSFNFYDAVVDQFRSTQFFSFYIKIYGLRQFVFSVSC